MALNKEQISTLLQFVATVTPDTLNCEACFEHVPELAESHLGDIPLTELLARVQKHLENCPCCDAEYKSFLSAMEAIEEAS